MSDERWVTSQEGHYAGRWIVHQPGPNRPNKVAYFQDKHDAERLIWAFRSHGESVREKCARVVQKHWEEATTPDGAQMCKWIAAAIREVEA